METPILPDRARIARNRAMLRRDYSRLRILANRRKLQPRKPVAAHVGYLSLELPLDAPITARSLHRFALVPA